MFLRKSKAIISPVLVIDALGFSAEIHDASVGSLSTLADKLNAQYFQFRAKVPSKVVIVGPAKVWSSGEFATLRLNDMFVLHAARKMDDPALRFAVCGSLLYQSMLIAGFIPRGGIGNGPIYRSREVLIGSGFLDAYAAAEKRDSSLKDICAIHIAPSFLAAMPDTKQAWRLVCFYKGSFFIHPYHLLDPDFGRFSPTRIIELLSRSGANAEKLHATERFLNNLEDYDSAEAAASASRRYLDDLGTPWIPESSVNRDSAS